jgi:hypothetical protein
MDQLQPIPRTPWWSKLAELLLQLVPLDTAYADLYVLRARDLAEPEFSLADFRALNLADESIHSLTRQVQEALDSGHWARVRALAQELESKKRLVQDGGSLRQLGEHLYERHDIHVDPFSPGFHWFHSRHEHDLSALRDAALAKLSQLADLDLGWSVRYREREAALRTTRLAQESAPRDSVDLQERARQAFASGDLVALQKIAARIQAGGAPTIGTISSRPEVPALEPTPLSIHFQQETVRKARAFGLEPEHVGNMRARLRFLVPHVWRPIAFESESGGEAGIRAALPRETPDALRDGQVVPISRPILTSGGARFRAPMVEEDVLVETFDEGPVGAPVGRNGLAEALGLKSRWGQSRLALERLLQARGPAIVESVGLDPWKFRLVSVPPDLFGVFGERRGWGKHEIWTHLDGYVATDERKLLGLVGGDVRYGGLQELVGVGAGYESDRLLTRFAILDRRRLRAW